MSKIIIIGAGAMGSAFAIPCLDNNHDTNIIGTHLENEFIDDLIKNNHFHPSLNISIPLAALALIELIAANVAVPVSPCVILPFGIFTCLS